MVEKEAPTRAVYPREGCATATEPPRYRHLGLLVHVHIYKHPDASHQGLAATCRAVEGSAGLGRALPSPAGAQNGPAEPCRGPKWPCRALPVAVGGCAHVGCGWRDERACAGLSIHLVQLSRLVSMHHIKAPAWHACNPHPFARMHAPTRARTHTPDDCETLRYALTLEDETWTPVQKLRRQIDDLVRL